MRYSMQSIILGTAFFATVALPVGGHTSTVGPPTTASQASSFQVFDSIPIETLNPRADGISSTLDPPGEGYKKGYSDGYAEGVRWGKQTCVIPEELDPATWKEGPYWEAYKQGYLAGFEKGFFEGCDWPA